MTDDETFLSLWQVTPRGTYRANFEWVEDSDECAGYLVLTSTRDGHRFEAAVSWAQMESFQRDAARHLHARSALRETGELPRFHSRGAPSTWGPPTEPPNP